MQLVEKAKHFFENMAVVSKIVEKAKLKSTIFGLEIGVGTGIMTVRILEEVKRLVAVELDPRMIAGDLEAGTRNKVSKSAAIYSRRCY